MKNFYRNFDKELFYDAVKDEYTMDFDENQKEAIEYALNHGLSARMIAYTHIPAENMWHMIDYMKEKYVSRDYDAVKLWKIGQSGLSEKVCESCVYALKHGISMVDEIQDIYMYDEQLIYLVSVAASYDENICKYITKGVRIEEIEDLVQNIIARHKRKEKLSL